MSGILLILVCFSTTSLAVEGGGVGVGGEKDLLPAHNLSVKTDVLPIRAVNSLAHGNLSSFISSQLSYHPLYLGLITLSQSQTLSCKSFALSPSLPLQCLGFA